MNESHNNEDQENENVFVISGNLETFFNANEIKTFINKDEIYDLSSLPQNSDKKLLAEDGIDPQKGSEIHLPQSLDENNFMNIDCFPEQISENIRKLYDPEDPEQNSTNIEDTEKIRHPTSSVFYKTNEKSITESQSEKIPGFSPQLKKEIESKEEKNFVKDEIPLTKIKTKDFKSSNILTKLQNSSQHLKKTEIFHDKKKKTQHSTKKPQENEEETKEKPNSEKNLQNEEDSSFKEDCANKQRENEQKSFLENQKENTIKEKKTKRPKKKRKTTEKKQKEPPLISVGLPFNSHDVFDHISNSESPDPLIKTKEKLKATPIINKEKQDDSLIKKPGESIKDPDFVLSLNLWAFIKDHSIPINDKFFLLFVLNMMLFDIILCIIELVYLSNSQCSDYNKNHAFVYINFIFTFIGKLIVLNFINLEVSCALPFDYTFPYIFPIILFGMFPSMQLPQFIFDYIQCSYRSPIFDINAAFQLMEFIGITFIALAGGACLITLCFNDLLTIRNRLINWSKSLFLLFIKFFVITLNVITIILTFTQIPSFVPALFIENVCFWFLVIVSIFGKFYNNKKKKIDEEVVMSKITEKQEKEKSDIP